MSGDRIGKPTGFLNATQGCQYLRWNFWVEFDVLFKFGNHRSNQNFRLALIDQFIVDANSVDFKGFFRLNISDDCGSGSSLHQNLYGAIG